MARISTKVAIRLVQPWNLKLKAFQTVVFCQKDIMKFEESNVIKQDGDL